MLLPSLRSAATDFPAGNFRACVAGRLRSEIIGPAVDDYGAADDVLHTEAVCEKNREGMPAAAEEGRQISGMIGVGAIVGIVMPANIGKGVALAAGTAGSGMDVKGEDRVTAWLLRLRQAGDMGRNEHAPAGLVKAHGSTDVGVLVAAPYLSNGRWPLSNTYKLIKVRHKVTSDHCMPGQRI